MIITMKFWILGPPHLPIFFLCLFFADVPKVVSDSESQSKTEKDEDKSALVFVKDLSAETSSNTNSKYQDLATPASLKSNNDDMETELFVATDEWQEVKQGQKIPAGLHVQMDFQTGKKFAKLLKDDRLKVKEKTNSKPVKDKKNIVKPKPGRKKRTRDRRKETSWDLGKKMGIINVEKKRYTRDELKKALKDFKYQNITPKDKETKEDQKFRSYDELKKVMQESKMSLKTEIDIVSDLFNKLKSLELDSKEINSILLDLEYYLHQLDNAKVFTDQGGLTLLKKLLNSTEDDIRANAAFALGAALQSNSKVQVAALDSGLMQQLVTSLSIDGSLQVRKKCLFALSTLVRQFPFAQKRLLDIGGLSALASLFGDTTDESLKIRIVTLLTDLLGEYDFNIKQVDSVDSVQTQRTKQYQMIELRSAMVSSGWCGHMTTLLESLDGHDSIEKLIAAMTAISDHCRQAFYPARSQLQTLKSLYHKLSLEERDDGDDDFFTSIYTSITSLVNNIVKDEL